MKNFILFFLVLGLCSFPAVVNGETAPSDRGYLFEGKISEVSEYHTSLFSEDFENAVNIRKRTDMWSFGGATVDVIDSDSAHGKAVQLLAQNGKRMYMQPHLLESGYETPTNEAAKPLEKLRFECDLKIDSGANVMIRCKTYGGTEDIALLHFKEGKILLFNDSSREIGAYNEDWHTYIVEVDGISGEVTAFMDEEVLVSGEVYSSLDKEIPGVVAFGIYASNETTDKYICIDNMKVLSASAEPKIEISGENDGEASYVLLPGEGATLIAALYENEALKEVRTVSAVAEEATLRLSIPYTIGQDMEIKAFCLESKETLIPLEENELRYALTAEDCDTVKNEWKKLLVGDENNDWSNEYEAQNLAEINSKANTVLDSMNLNDDATVLFGTEEVTTTAQMSSQYRDMYRLALAYGTYGAKLYKDAGLKEKILYAMDYLYENLYGQDEINGTGWKSMEDYNWYDWYSDVPAYLMDTMIILGDDITDEDIAKYIAPFKYMHAWQSTGDNVGDRISRLSNSTAFAVLTKDTSLLRENLDDLQKILPTVENGDGYREDGMFIFHTRYPYTGLYGINTLVGTVLPVEKALGSVNGAFTEKDKDILLNHFKETYEPVVYNGRMMSMLMGRERGRTEERYEGLQVIRAVLSVIDMYDGGEREYLEEIIRRNIPKTDDKEYYLDGAQTGTAEALLEILAEDYSSAEYTNCKVYYSGDRVVQQRNGYAVGLAMSSERVPSYESINSANKNGWFTGDGMLYIYTPDGYENQFTPEYWQNVDMAKLPGTTEDTRERKEISISNTNSYIPPVSFVGGAEYDKKYAVAAMDFVGFNNENEPASSNDSGYGGEKEYFTSTLKAKKAWFMFDNEVVALGSGISSEDGAEVNTYIANFMLNGTEEKTSGVNWLHLDRMGGVYLPHSDEIVTNITGGENSFFQIWTPHGVNPENDTYAYVVLPDKSAAETASYAQNSDIEILSNTLQIQAVRENTLGITGIVFHETGAFENITVSEPLILIYDGNTVKISDPTQKLDSVTVTVGTKTYAFDLSNCKGETLTAKISS